MQWNVEVGDEVAVGGEYCEIETDVAWVPFEAFEDRDVFVAKLLLEPGTTVPIGTPAAVLVEDKTDIAAFEDFEPPGL